MKRITLALAALIITIGANAQLLWKISGNGLTKPSYLFGTHHVAPLSVIEGCPVITVEDGTINGGLGGAVAEWLAANNYSRPVTRLGIPDRFIPQGTPDEQHHMCGFDTGAILAAIENAKRNSDCKTTTK